jgi:hypothetical protein
LIKIFNTIKMKSKSLTNKESIDFENKVYNLGVDDRYTGRSSLDFIPGKKHVNKKLNVFSYK